MLWQERHDGKAQEPVVAIPGISPDFFQEEAHIGTYLHSNGTQLIVSYDLYLILSKVKSVNSLPKRSISDIGC